MSGKCSICGCAYDTHPFRCGYVCEDCISYVKDQFEADTLVRY